MNLLKGTKFTVIGPIQYSNGHGIRDYFKKELKSLGIIIYDHYDKPFMSEYVQEDDNTIKQIRYWIKNGEYNKVAALRAIRTYDLNLIDRSDAIIFHFIPGVVTCGSWEEFFWANRLKKPIFFITEGGKNLTPAWVFWTIKHKYIYNSKEEVLQMIKDIDSGKKTIDSERWRLLKPEFR